MRKRNNKTTKRGILYSLVAMGILALIGFMSYVYFTVNNYNNLVYPGVKVGSVDLSGKTKNDALKLLKERYGEKAIQQNQINLKSKNKTYTIDYSKLDAKYDIAGIIDEVFNYGKDLNIFQKYNLIRNKEKQYKMEFTYKSEPIKNVIDMIEKDTNCEPKNAYLKRKGTSDFEIIAGQEGMKVSVEKLKKDIKDKINETEAGNFTLDIPVKKIEPKVTKQKLSSVNSLIASYNTSFRTSSYGRATNVRVATNSINGIILMPGEVFSFNDVVGPRTAERGYKNAAVIIGNKVEPGLGGGVCQVSTTLYNAVLKSGLKSVERTNHTLVSHYVPKGRDATVSYGSLDYKFKNTTEHPVYIEGYTANKVLYFNIYSNNSLKKRTYTIENNVYDTVEAKVEYQDDPNLEEGKTEVIQKAHTGFKVKVYRNIYENGKFVKKELISKDYYRPVNGLSKRGTKKPESAETETDEKKPNDDTNNTNEENANNESSSDESNSSESDNSTSNP
ncbi:VanW family protein [Haloimpatiens sp. FM7330]|uniref:VanW family protein n=1 Tax=Haloimpatiens sp. FM7330 TaxID=3298610 RepID=UPI0036401240